jgi:hypothetical protein
MIVLKEGAEIPPPHAPAAQRCHLLEALSSRHHRAGRQLTPALVIKACPLDEAIFQSAHSFPQVAWRM